jgi:hypothetical protein
MLIFSHHFWLLSLVGYCSYLNMVKWLQQVEGFPVHSMATPTIGGARAVLTHLKAEPSFGVSGKKAVVTDLREEVVVYVHGNPYVLREVDQPASTLKHVGIKGPVVMAVLSFLPRICRCAF